MLTEKGQNLAQTDKGSYYNQEEWLEEFLDDKGAIYNGGVLQEKMFLRILQISQKNACLGVFFSGLRSATLLKKVL